MTKQEGNWWRNVTLATASLVLAATWSLGGCGSGDGDESHGGEEPALATGWSDPRLLLVPSDGSHSLGDPEAEFNDSRDQGSKIAYFHPDAGDDESADVYFWDGERLVDSTGSPENEDGKAYGTDPLAPNEAAIRPFSTFTASGDDRLATQQGRAYEGDDNAFRFAGLAGGYPDWFLFRRGETHTAFDTAFVGGRSEAEPMVVGAYGPLQDGRAIMDPSEDGTNPFSKHNWGEPKSWFHHALFSLEIRAGYGYLNAHTADTHSDTGGPVTAYLEDCYFPSREGGILSYPPKKTTLYRSILTGSYLDEAHNQGYFTSGFKNEVTFDGVIFYKNGYKNDPFKNADPKRDIFSRNVYQGGGAKLGHVYHNVIGADGASGGPQMRLGGIIENSLIIEGYWYSSTSSNQEVNDWLEQDGQVGQSARVRNNVQLVFDYPSPADPDTADDSDQRAQPQWGYALQGASFGALVEGNVISGAMLLDDLRVERATGHGINLVMPYQQYEGGKWFAQKDNTLRENIIYRVGRGLSLGEGGAEAENVVVTDNVFLADQGLSIREESTVTSAEQVSIEGNRFYTEEALPEAEWLGENEVTEAGAETAAEAEGWPDPDRTLKRYVLEVLKMELLDWDDDPWLDPDQAAARKSAGEAYDPTGLKTFMAVAAHMRLGGTLGTPSGAKPELGADYAWDERLEAIAVVNWIREGFGMEPVERGVPDADE